MTLTVPLVGVPPMFVAVRVYEPVPAWAKAPVCDFETTRSGAGGGGGCVGAAAGLGRAVARPAAAAQCGDRQAAGGRVDDRDGAARRGAADVRDAERVRAGAALRERAGVGLHDDEIGRGGRGSE